MKCWNKKTLAVVAAGALAVLAFAPSAFGWALPFLLIAACPLGMLLMARGAMSGCRTQGSERPAGQTTASDEAAQAEIAQLRQEVERLRAGAEHPAPASPTSPRAGDDRPPGGAR